MKTVIISLVVSLLLIACKKDLSSCKDYTQITGRTGGIALSAVPEAAMRDTLAKYPQLEVYQAQSNSYSNSMTCRVYYKDLLIFSDEYSLFRFKSTDSLVQAGTPVNTPLSISLAPKIKIEDAIKEARKYVNFDRSCISYQLGLYNKNRWLNVTPDYRLAWRVFDSQKQYLSVIIDAQDNSMLYNEGGTIYWAY